ncbi:MAG TPA: FtsH protease activity modulator HflK [Alphaproteobacteria bacterium]|nr:FtsH protease activity modulator HflK [Alphaproteobacteria bacterium]
MSSLTNIFSGPWGDDKSGKTSEKTEKIIKETILDFKKEAERVRKGSSNNNYGGGDFEVPNPNKLFAIVLVAGVALWLASGFYKITPGEEGVVLRFGKYIQTTQPGLNYHLPSPIETVIKVNTQLDNSTEIGFRSLGKAARYYANRRGGNDSDIRDVPSESLMLTGDQRIVDLDFEVLWRVGNAKDYLFNLENPQKTIHDVAETAIREVIGTHKLDDALTDGKTKIKNEVRDLMSKVLDDYKSGIIITGLQWRQVQPPAPVKQAFLDVKAALKDADRMRNEAEGYANDIIPKAKGQAEQILQDADAYAQSKVAAAKGEADRFEQQLKAYNQAKSITEKRLYIEAMEEVLANSNKVIMSKNAGGNVLPYLPLDKKNNVR